MKIKSALFLVSFLTISFALAQSSLNNYKYVIVEKQFHFQTEPNQYDLNRIVKYLFESVGFQVIIQGQAIPKELSSNYCLALNSEVVISGMLRTKAQVHLRNCEGEIVYSTEEGVTKEKEHKRAYNIAIHKAFESFNEVWYRYEPKEDKEEDVVTKIEEVNSDVSATPTKVEVKTVESNAETLEVATAAKAADEATKNNIETSSNKDEVQQLEARKIENGFELLNNSEIVMIMLESGINSVYLVKDQNAVIYKEGEKWLYNDRSKKNNKPVELNIKF